MAIREATGGRCPGRARSVVRSGTAPVCTAKCRPSGAKRGRVYPSVAMKPMGRRSMDTTLPMIFPGIPGARTGASETASPLATVAVGFVAGLGFGGLRADWQPVIAAKLTQHATRSTCPALREREAAPVAQERDGCGDGFSRASMGCCKWSARFRECPVALDQVQSSHQSAQAPG